MILLPGAKSHSQLTAKVHARPHGGMSRVVVALCDSELLGKIYTQGERVLDLKNYRGFYEGAAVTEIEAIELLRMADNANIVGEKSVRRFLNRNENDKENPALAILQNLRR